MHFHYFLASPFKRNGQTKSTITHTFFFGLPKSISVKLESIFASKKSAYTMAKESLFHFTVKRHIACSLPTNSLCKYRQPMEV